MWKLIYDESEEGLTDAELIGLSIYVGSHEELASGTHPANATTDQLRRHVYARAWHKIQEAVQVALGRDG